MSKQATETRENKALRALVIGAGPMAAAVHLPLLSRLRDRREIVLCVVCDLNRTRAMEAQQKFGFTEHTGDATGALAREDIDVVYIFGSAQLHHRHGLEALRHGCHLFVEKPIAPSYALAVELSRTAEQYGLIAVGGHNRRFYEAFAELRARAGEAGWRFAEAVFHKPEAGKPAPFGARTWLGANGIHALDALIYMMGGLPAELSAHAGAAAAKVPSAFSALMRWKDGAQGVFICNNDAGSRREEYAFHGLAETYRVDARGLTIEGRETTNLALPILHDGFAAEHDAFLRAIRDGAAPAHSLARLAPSLYVAELIESGYSGHVVLPPTLQKKVAMTRGDKPAARMDCVLADDAGELHGVLGRLLPRCRLVSRSDVLRSGEVGPRVRAAILGRGASPLSTDELERMPRLEMVGMVALSLSNHAPDALLARNIKIVNASQAYAESVAEFALALAILGRRRAFTSHEVMRRGGWGVACARTSAFAALLSRAGRSVRPLAKAVGLERRLLTLWKGYSKNARLGSAVTLTEPRTLDGATVGLIGWGANSRAFAARLLQARAIVSVHSRHASPAAITAVGAMPVSLREALGSDIVSLHRGLTSATRHGLGQAELSAIRPGAVLINVARGALIEPHALHERLKRGDLFACLDTYESEPLRGPHPLRSLPNVFLTSHIAGGSRDMHVAAAVEVVGKIAEHLDGRCVEEVTAAHLQAMS